MAVPLDLDFTLDFEEVDPYTQVNMATAHLNGLALVGEMAFPNVPLHHRWEIPLDDYLNFDWALLFSKVPRVRTMLECRWAEAIHRLTIRFVSPGVIAPTVDICPGVMFASDLQHAGTRSVLGQIFLTRVRLRKCHNQLEECMLRECRPNLRQQVIFNGLACPYDERRINRLRHLSSVLLEIDDELLVLEEAMCSHLDELFELPELLSTFHL